MAKLLALDVGKTIEIDRGEKFILAQLAAIGDGMSITTGIQPKDFDTVQTFRGKRIGKTPVGEYAAYNEFGTKFSPPRPFMQKTLETNMNLFVKQTVAGMRSIYNSQLTADALLQRQAKRTEKWMKKSIVTWGVPGNSPSTRKINRRSSTGPLMDTRTMIKAISSDTQRGLSGLRPDFKAFLMRVDSLAKRRGILGRF